eukprot:jgi/Undpi1/12791/HiC_scaffold_7.g02458.m1
MRAFRSSASSLGSTLLLCGSALLRLRSVGAAFARVDVRPCIIVPSEIIKDVSATSEAYMATLMYSGFWAAKQYVIEADTTTSLDALLNVNTRRGRCNVVFVGIEPSAAQKLTLQDCEQLRCFFRPSVRLVYFETSKSWSDTEVMARLGAQELYLDPLVGVEGIKFTSAGGQDARVVKSDMVTDPSINVLFNHPISQPAAIDGVTIVAEYATQAGVTLTTTEGYPSASIMTYLGDDGLEEMHVFFAMAWFDLGSWAWMHYINEWGTKGIFMGERRFYLAGMVDDLFLATGVFEYDGDQNEGAEVTIYDLKQRSTGDNHKPNMQAFKAAEASINAQYGSSIMTEFPFNGLGILEKVSNLSAVRLIDGVVSTPRFSSVEACAALTSWHEYASGDWDSDDLLEWCVNNKDAFWWQSHTLTHLARDNLGESDCSIEDGGNAQIAVLTGLFGSDNYNWRSMTNPGITGLFNKYCLESAMDNLMACGPGDNTYDGVQTTVSLVSSESPYHSIYTTTAVNEYAGFQIVPRFATNVYFNCVTADCLVKENEFIRRDTCECEELDPSIADNGLCDGDIESFGSTDALFTWEAQTASRYILAGHRDKYMFHQANVIPASDLSGSPSLLEYWYQQVMEELTSYLAFPVTSKKFDDLCSEFTLHEDLDYAEPYAIADIDTATGNIVNLRMRTKRRRTVGFIPITVPSTLTVNTGSLVVGSTETYGSDTTIYLASDADLVPVPATAPDARSLRTLYTEDLTVVLHLSGRPVGILETSRELLFVPKDKNFRGSNRSFDGPMTGEVVNHR